MANNDKKKCIGFTYDPAEYRIDLSDKDVRQSIEETEIALSRNEEVYAPDEVAIYENIITL